MRELTWMATGRRTDQWWHTASLLAMLVNINRDPKTSAVAAAEFHPFTPRRKIKREMMPITFLRDIFVPKNPAVVAGALIGGGDVPLSEMKPL